MFQNIYLVTIVSELLLLTLEGLFETVYFLALLLVLVLYFFQFEGDAFEVDDF